MASTKKKRTRRSNRPFPSTRLEKALIVAETVNAKSPDRPMNRVLLAKEIGRSPTSSAFEGLVASSAAYGLTGGGPTGTIQLDTLGKTLTNPLDDSERAAALRSAFSSVPLFSRILDHYANKKLPDDEYFSNALKRSPFDLDPAWSAQTVAAFRKDARFVGYIQDLPSGEHIVIDAPTLPPPEEETPDDADDEDPPGPTEPDEDVRHPEPKSETAGERLQFFIAHGSNHEPVNQLEGMLNSWNIEYKIAEKEANAGRPISKKVADTMRQCTAGIFIFTTEDGFFDEDGNPMSQPNLNVVFELGAASLLYGRKIVIFRQSEVKFPSNFSDLGWITFEGNDLESKSFQLLKELMELGAVRLVSGP